MTYLAQYHISENETAIDLAAFGMLPVIALLREEKDIAVAVSGGPDSMALCFLLSQWSESINGPRLHALTVDHGLRSESRQEAEATGERLKNLPRTGHTVLKRDMNNVSATSIQEEARRDRYALMQGYCEDKAIRYLLLAHHRDDQAETFLFRLAKGSGLDGLAAMRAITPLTDHVSLLRPFLDFPKSCLVATCRANNLPFVSDPSNTNEKFARVRLRHAADSLAREGLDAKRLAVTAARFARAREALEHYTALTWKESLIDTGQKILIFNLKILQSAPEEIRLRILRQAIVQIAVEGGSSYGPRLERLEEIMSQMFGIPDFRAATLGGCLLSLDRRAGTLSVQPENTRK